MQYVVQSEQEFYNLAKTLQGGDVVAFAAGQYDTMTFKDLNFASEVKITSLDANNPAVFADKTAIINSSNLTFENLSFELKTATDTSSYAYNSLLYLTDSSSIKISQNNIQGIVSTTGQDPNAVTNPDAEIIGYATGSGISLNNVQDVTILNNDIHDLRFGISFRDTQDTLVSGNHIHDIRTDGIRGTDQINTVIESNLFENFHPWHGPNTTIGDHADMIQYWGAGASFGIDGFVVKNNIFFQEDDYTQTVFGRLGLSANQDPTQISFQNFEVSGNLIYNGHTHGITLSGIDGVKVFDNTLIPNQYALANNTFPTIGIYGDTTSVIRDPVTGKFIVNPNFTLAGDGVDRPVVNAEVYNNITPVADWLGGAIPAYNDVRTNADDYINQMAGINIHDNTITSITATNPNYFMKFFASFDSSNGITLQDLLIAANSSAGLAGHGSPYSYGAVLDLSNTPQSLPPVTPTVPPVSQVPDDTTTVPPVNQVPDDTATPTVPDTQTPPVVDTGSTEGTGSETSGGGEAQPPVVVDDSTQTPAPGETGTESGEEAPVTGEDSTPAPEDDSAGEASGETGSESSNGDGDGEVDVPVVVVEDGEQAQEPSSEDSESVPPVAEEEEVAESGESDMPVSEDTVSEESEEEAPTEEEPEVPVVVVEEKPEEPEVVEVKPKDKLYDDKDHIWGGGKANAAGHIGKDVSSKDKISKLDLDLGKDTVKILQVIDNHHLDKTTKAINDFVYSRTKSGFGDAPVKHADAGFAHKAAAHGHDFSKSHDTLVDDVHAKINTHL